MSRTAASGLSPANVNLDAFGYPPHKSAPDARPLHSTLPHAPRVPHKRHKPAKPPASASTDDEDVFSLDMVTMDMGFEQAYCMYLLMQQKNAALGVEELQRAQLMDAGISLDRSCLLLYAQTPSKATPALTKPSLLSPPGEAVEEPLFLTHRALYPRTAKDASKPYAAALPDLGAYREEKEFDALQQEAHTFSHESQLLAGLLNTGVVSGGVYDNEDCDDDDDDSHDELDHFFSSTESNALDKFLDNLASSNLANPLDLYNHGQPVTPQLFDLHTIGMAEQKLFVPGTYFSVKAPESFTHPAVHNFGALETLPSGLPSELPAGLPSELPSALPSKFPSELPSKFPSALPSALPAMRSTRLATVDKPTEAPQDQDARWRSPEEPKKRKLSKELLTLAQKRLNHSHSEQRRRLLCKQAYERCLRLVTNVDDYKNELVLASALTSASKNSKRKQINKDGLPNLSKHAALLKISLEIIKIREKNEKLQQLIAAYN